MTNGSLTSFTAFLKSTIVSPELSLTRIWSRPVLRGILRQDDLMDDSEKNAKLTRTIRVLYGTDPVEAQRQLDWCNDNLDSDDDIPVIAQTLREIIGEQSA